MSGIFREDWLDMPKIRKGTIEIFTSFHLIPQLIYPKVFVKPKISNLNFYLLLSHSNMQCLFFYENLNTFSKYRKGKNYSMGP